MVQVPDGILSILTQVFLVFLIPTRQKLGEASVRQWPISYNSLFSNYSSILFYSIWSKLLTVTK